MKTKTYLIVSIALLMGVSAWADDVWNYNVYDICSKNGYKAGYVPAPADVQAVDLGLPSGLKWASHNVGAIKPSGYGKYYAWGEVLPKDDYSWTNYKYANGADNKLTKYCSDAKYGNKGFTDNKTTLDPKDDAAHVNWGGSWRCPTDVEWTELQVHCTWTWTRQNGVLGYQVTSKTNGNSIFLPSTQYRKGTGFGSGDANFYYWSSSLDREYPRYAKFFPDWSSTSAPRIYGMLVRPVRP